MCVGERAPLQTTCVLAAKECCYAMKLLEWFCGLKFGAGLSIICGFLTVASCWRHIVHYHVTMLSFLRLLKLRKLVVCKLDLSAGGGRVLLGVTVCSTMD